MVKFNKEKFGSFLKLYLGKSKDIESVISVYTKYCEGNDGFDSASSLLALLSNEDGNVVEFDWKASSDEFLDCMKLILRYYGHKFTAKDFSIADSEASVDEAISWFADYIKKAYGLSLLYFNTDSDQCVIGLVPHENSKKAVELFNGMQDPLHVRASVVECIKMPAIDSGENIVQSIEGGEIDYYKTLDANGIGKYHHYKFGKFPDAVESDEEIIKKLDVSSVNEQGYYVVDNVEYVKRLATLNPKSTKGNFRSGAIIEGGKEYYFKVSPIRWCILSESEKELKLISSLIIESMYYVDLPQGQTSLETSNKSYLYAEGTLRPFLTDKFYNMAFDDTQKAMLKINAVSEKQGCIGAVKITHQDKVYALDEAEAKNASNVFTTTIYAQKPEKPFKCAVISDYARANLGIIRDRGYSDWWLRTNYGYVSYDGLVGGETPMVLKNRGVKGVRPVIVLPKKNLKVNEHME